MRGTFPKALLCILGATAAFAQVSTSAYRVLGQTDLQKNGLNLVQGTELRTPGGIALDVRDGVLHIYICDTGNARVLAWRDAASYQVGDPPALILGQQGPGYSNPNGIGVKGLNKPTAVAVDPRNGDLYVADTGDNRVVRFPAPFANPTRIEPDAVYGQPGFTSIDAGSGQGRFNQPRGVAVDAAGNLWVADSSNHRVVRISASNLNAANPQADMLLGQRDYQGGAANQGGTTSASTLYAPAGLAFDAQGNLYVADFGNTRVLRFPVSSLSVMDAAADAVWGQSSFTTRGVPAQASAWTIAGPLGLTIDVAGNLYVASLLDNRVLVFPQGATGGSGGSTVFGQGDFTTTTANTGVSPLASANTLSAPADVKVDADGNVFVADSGNNRVLTFARGSKSAVRLWGQTDYSANGANQVKAGSINAAYKMVIDYSQAPYALYVSDLGNHRVLIWRDSTKFRNGDPADLVIGQPDLRTAIPNVDSQSVSTPSATSLAYPAGLALNPYDGALYVADSGNNRVLRYPRPVDQTGRIAPDAVIGQVDFTSNTSAAVSAVSLNTPTGLAFSAEGHLFVADTGNNRVLEFPSGAGTGSSAIRVYGQPNMTSAIKPTQSTPQTLMSPRGIFVDPASNLYVADSGANRVMVFANTQDAPPSSSVAAYSIGGVFKSPMDVVTDSSGSIYVTDTGNNRVVRLSSLISMIMNPTVVAILGQPDAKGTTANWDGAYGLASADSLYAPLGLYIDRQDTLYVGDAGNNRVLHFPKWAAVVNAASFQTGAPVSRSGLATIMGDGLSADSASAPVAGWPNTLANRKIVVNDDLEAPLSLMSTTQANFQVPSGAPLGAQRIAVRTADTGELVAGGTILIASVSPGLFTVSQNGSGQGLVFNQDGSPNGPSNPAAIGSTITLYGTGQGQVSPAVSDGEGAPASIAATVAVPTADGKTCLTVQPSMCVAIGSGFGNVLASSLAPGYVGLWQVKVTIPQGISPGGVVPLRAVVNGSPSNIVTVAVK